MTPQEKDDLKRISRVMRAARKLSGRNQADIARQLQVTQSCLSKMESGHIIPSASQWFTFCLLLGLDSHDTFMTGTIDNQFSVAPNSSYAESSFKISREYSRNAATMVRAVRPFLKYFSDELGEEALRDYCQTAGADPDYFVVLDNQISIRFTLDLVSQLIERGKLTPSDFDRIARPSNQRQMHGKLHREYDRAATPHELLHALIRNNPKYETNFKYRVENESASEIVMSITPEAHMKGFDYGGAELQNFMCGYKKHYFKNFMSYGGLKSQAESQAEIHECQCQFKGHDRCVYKIRLAS